MTLLCNRPCCLAACRALPQVVTAGSTPPALRPSLWQCWRGATHWHWGITPTTLLLVSACLCLCLCGNHKSRHHHNQLSGHPYNQLPRRYDSGAMLSRAAGALACLSVLPWGKASSSSRKPLLQERNSCNSQGALRSCKLPLQAATGVAAERLCAAPAGTQPNVLEVSFAWELSAGDEAWLRAYVPSVPLLDLEAAGV